MKYSFHSRVGLAIACHGQALKSFRTLYRKGGLGVEKEMGTLACATKSGSWSGIARRVAPWRSGEHAMGHAGGTLRDCFAYARNDSSKRKAIANAAALRGAQRRGNLNGTAPPQPEPHPRDCFACARNDSGNGKAIAKAPVMAKSAATQQPRWRSTTPTGATSPGLLRSRSQCAVVIESAHKDGRGHGCEKNRLGIHPAGSLLNLALESIFNLLDAIQIPGGLYTVLGLGEVPQLAYSNPLAVFFQFGIEDHAGFQAVIQFAHLVQTGR